MQHASEPETFWQRWLIVVTIGVMLFGLVMVLAPNLTQQGFSLMLYPSPDRIADFGGDAIAYIQLVHAVLGAVMFGWGAALLFVVLGPLRRAPREGWQIIAVSVVAWFVPDTAFSLWSGFWQNAVLNFTFAILFAVPLAATYRRIHAGAISES
jgi:hypothetical protein